MKLYAIDHPYTEHITIDAQIPFENQILSNEKVWTIKKSCWMRKENRITSYWSRWNCQAVVLIVRPIKINGNWHHTHTRCVQKKNEREKFYSILRIIVSSHFYPEFVSLVAGTPTQRIDTLFSFFFWLLFVDFPNPQCIERTHTKTSNWKAF